VWFPTSPEDLQYDDDGNLTQDGRWNFTWNAENRLIRTETREDVATATGMPRERLDMAYDAMGRRIRKAVYQLETLNLEPETWVLKSDLRFLYEGTSWNLVAELNLKPETSNLELVRSYAWGTDISGTVTGAGGVGGLLLVQRGGVVEAPCYDGNGNISTYVKVVDGAVSSRHDYDAFGRPIWNELEGTGVKQAAASPFGFSTKYTDSETGWVHYGFRYYSPELGRWPSRDPMLEITGEHPEFMEEGPNLYGFVHNDPVNGYDFMGLKWRKVGKTKDERRLIWERDDPARDTMEELAKKVDLDPQEASRWAKPDEKNSCRFTTPNVWIMVKMLHGIHSVWDIFINPGDEIGDLFTFTGSRKTVNVSSPGAIVSAINRYRSDIIGLSIYGHGNIGIVGGTGSDFEYAHNILSAIDGNGFKLKEAHLMQCYSGAGGYDVLWKARCYKGRAIVYYGVNVCGIETGKKPKPPLRP
jgi:RHS repeat-associated protein